MTTTRLAQSNSQYERSAMTDRVRHPETNLDDPAVIAIMPMIT